MHLASRVGGVRIGGQFAGEAVVEVQAVQRLKFHRTHRIRLVQKSVIETKFNKIVRTGAGVAQTLVNGPPRGPRSWAGTAT